METTSFISPARESEGYVTKSSETIRFIRKSRRIWCNRLDIGALQFSFTNGRELFPSENSSYQHFRLDRAAGEFLVGLKSYSTTNAL